MGWHNVSKVPYSTTKAPETPAPAWEWGIAALLLAGFAIAYAHLALQRETLLNSDFFGFARRMDRLGNAPWQEAWVDGLYPVGYPLLIKSLAPAFGGYASAARWVSVLSGLVGLGSLWVLARRWGGLRLALPAVLFTGGNHWFTTFSTSEGTDAPALALIMLALALVSAPRLPKGRLVVIGLLLGIGYLVRYTALLALPALALAWWAEGIHDWRAVAKRMAWVAAVFAVASSPQWIASLLVTGNPLYNTQHWNIWYAMKGNGKWWRIATEGVKHSNAIAVVRDVGLIPFLHNFLLNILRLGIWDIFLYPLHLLWLVGVSMTVWWRRRPALLALAMAAVYGAAISLAFLSQRVLLLLIPLQIVLSLYPVAEIARRWPRIGWRILLPAVLIGGLAYTWHWYDLTQAIIHTPYSSAQVALPKALRQAGMRQPEEVLSFSHNLYDVGSYDCRRFATPWLGSPVPVHSEAEVVWMAVAGGYRFVVTDMYAEADMAGFSSWYPKRRLSPPLQLVFKTGVAECYAVTDTLRTRFRPAQEGDWQQFATMSHSDKIGEWAKRQAVLQEKAPLPTGFDVELLSAWRRYKGENRLL